MRVRICNSSTPTNTYSPDQYHEMTSEELDDFLEEKLDAYMESINLGYEEVGRILQDLDEEDPEYEEMINKLDNLDAIETFQKAGINCIDIEGFRIDLNSYFTNYIGNYADLF